MNKPFSAVFFLLLSPALHAQFSTSAWKGNGTSGITADSLWAAHFGSSTNTTIDGKAVTGVTGTSPAIAEKFSTSGFTAVFNNDSNALTAIGSGGSAVVGKDFVYGGAPATITLEGLTAGQTYTVSFLSTSWTGDQGQPANFRSITFSSGDDSLLVDQDQFGFDSSTHGKGIRVDYAFTATGATRAISLEVSNANSATWHLYGLSLRATSYVVTSAADDGAGSLRDLIPQVPSGATITFAPALAGEVIPVGAAMAIGKNLTIDGGAGMTLDGGEEGRILTIGSGKTVALRNLTLQRGSMFNPGGGILNQGSLSLSQCTLRSCSSDSGGAIENSVGSLLLERCTLYDNEATGSSGGAIRNSDGTVTLVQCTIVGNTGWYAGAISNISGSLKMRHCTVVGNETRNFDGAIKSDSSLEIFNCIIAGNTSATGAKDITSDSSSVFSHLGANIVQDYQVVTGGTESGPAVIDADPMLAALGNYGGPTQTRPPLPGSPALDAGVNQYAVDADNILLTTDQRGTGHARFFDADGDDTDTVDIGAFEAAPEISIKQGGVNLADGVNTIQFGNVKVGKTGAAKTFTIINKGTAVLTGFSVAKSGANKSEFVVVKPGKTSLAPGGSTTFTVSFKPKAAGQRKAGIRVASNDEDENPFDIKVAGTGKKP